MTAITIAISGSGGAGAISTGEMLLRIAGRSGYYGILKKTFSPQIRGGEAAAILRLGDTPVDTFTGEVDILVAFDWQNFSRFADEVPVSAATLVIQNSGAGELPAEIKAHSNLVTLDGSGIAASASSDWINLVFLGLIAKALACSEDTATKAVIKRLAKYDSALKEAALRSLQAGQAIDTPAQLAEKITFRVSLPPTDNRWLASGNQMAALGALEAGVRFVAAYPITPASDLLETIAQRIEDCGGHLVQAEDELAAINMTIGAGFGGVPAMTATSGPGLALMTEAMGLAVASETPVVVIDVMRGGPSTGIPTKSEQSDFNIAVYGLHGDAPHVVLACSSIPDCYHTTAWAVELATRLQTLVIVLSDQFLGQSLQIMATPPQCRFKAGFAKAEVNNDQPYLRYLDTDSGISPLALPGEPGAMYTADGLEHSQNAVPSPKAGEHQRQLDKRQRKLSSHDFGEHWGELQGSVAGKPLVICWGSVSAAAREARQQLADRGITTACLCLRQLSPLPVATLEPLLAQASRLLVVEHNHSAQFCHYLQGQLPQFSYQSLALPGPKLITAGQIMAALQEAPETFTAAEVTDA